MVRPSGSRSLTVVQQALALRSRYKSARQPVVRGNRLTWTVRLRPTPLSVMYTVRLRYDPANPRPQVTVLDPALADPWGAGLPHVFPGDELCLYYDEFDAAVDLIADKMVPWISEWLYYYELWLTTGDWLGGGIHPEDNAVAN